MSNLFKKYNVKTVWAAWGDKVFESDFLKKELKILLNRIPVNVEWITIGEITRKGNPVFDGKSLKFTKMKPFDIKVYLKKHYR